MSPAMPPIDFAPTVQVETIGEGFPDAITVYHVCGEVVYVGPGVPSYYVMPGTLCSALPGKMGLVGIK